MMVERSAKITAINISYVVLKTGKGKNIIYPVCVTSEGFTFYGLKNLKTRVEFYLREFYQKKNRGIRKLSM